MSNYGNSGYTWQMMYDPGLGNEDKRIHLFSSIQQIHKAEPKPIFTSQRTPIMNIAWWSLMPVGGGAIKISMGTIVRLEILTTNPIAKLQMNHICNSYLKQIFFHPTIYQL